MPVRKSQVIAPTSMTSRSDLASRIAAAPHPHDNDNPLWLGPCAPSPLGGITQSMLVRFLSCRERFRLKYVLGLEPYDKWNKNLGYGNMWHCAEEHFAADGKWGAELAQHTKEQLYLFPMQREEIIKWWNVCLVQFPEYTRYWSDHPDVKNRTPLMQEQVFDVPYELPSGRVVRLRGKFDLVDLIDGGIYLQENKTKGDIDKEQVERQLKFDLQTMMYLIALPLQLKEDLRIRGVQNELYDYPIKGVRYNVVRRPLSGGKGSIRPHAAKSTKTKFTPAESDEVFYERLRKDYIADDPSYWFFRVRSEVSVADTQVFRSTCLDPLLETVCSWYEAVVTHRAAGSGWRSSAMNYRTPFGVWSALEENGSTEYDAFLATGSEAGLRRVEKLFPELEDA